MNRLQTGPTAATDTCLMCGVALRIQHDETTWFDTYGGGCCYGTSRTHQPRSEPAVAAMTNDELVAKLRAARGTITVDLTTPESDLTVAVQKGDLVDQIEALDPDAPADFDLTVTVEATAIHAAVWLFAAAKR